MKFLDGLVGVGLKRRSPHGERGLKFPKLFPVAPGGASLPARGAWVEIADGSNPQARKPVAPRTGSVG